MLSACATPPDPGNFHPFQPGRMEDVKDNAVKRREAPGSEVTLGEYGRASSMLSITSEADGAPRASKSPRRIGQPIHYHWFRERHQSYHLQQSDSPQAVLEAVGMWLMHHPVVLRCWVMRRRAQTFTSVLAKVRKS